MKNQHIIIGGVHFDVKCPEIGFSCVFSGARYIVASAIKRTSKNRYHIYVIFENNAMDYAVDSFGEAKKLLQSLYDKYGCL